MIQIPDDALEAPSLSDPKRFHQFALLCGSTAVKEGVYCSTSGIPALLKKGQACLSQKELAKLWGTTESSARRSVQAFDKDGLIVVYGGAAAKIEGEETPVSGVITVLGLADG